MIGRASLIGFCVVIGCLTTMSAAVDRTQSLLSGSMWFVEPSRSALQSTASVAQTDGSPQRVFLKGYCLTCHNDRLKTGGLVLETLDLTNVSADAEVWEKVIRKLRAGTMPPVGMPRPDDVARGRFVSWLETEIDRAAALNPNPGRTETFHRLNRTEYRNAVRDLLSVEIDVADLLPLDDTGGGFDNMASVLKISESVMGAYLSAAGKISRMAIGTNSVAATPAEAIFDLPEELPQYTRMEGLPLGTRGGALIRHTFPADAEYEFEIDLTGARNYYLTEELEIVIDGERAHLFRLPGTRELNERGEAVKAAEATIAQLDGDIVAGIRYYLARGVPIGEIAQLYLMPLDQVQAVALAASGPERVQSPVQVRLPVKSGLRNVGVTFVQTVQTEAEGARLPFEIPGGSLMPIAQPFVGSVKITGPFNATGSKELPSRQRIFVCMPAVAEEAACARTILSTLARRAYRRPVTDDDVERLLAFYDRARADGGAFDAGIELALQRLLVSPEFLFRIEIPPAAGRPGINVVSSGQSNQSNYDISDVDLASRLSFFLWSSIPDDELLNLAAQGRLSEPAVLDREVRRMLADPRSEALTNNFAGQWLQLRDLATAAPHSYTFPDFDESLRQTLRRESELFFDSIVRDGRSVLDLIDADYTFVNERLARHYGIPFVSGSHFRRVTLPPDSPRRGILGKASILVVTSNPVRTSPVRRGKWILENILGSPPPRPPANVPPFPEKKPGQLKVLTVRERQAEHRKNPACAQCHAMIDPPGFGMEQFDAVGRWREFDEGLTPIDASGMLPDGTEFDGVVGLRAALLQEPELFVATLTQKLLQYALGRELEYYDMPAVRAIVREAARDDFRFWTLISGIVKSTPFTSRRYDMEPVPQQASRSPG